MIKNDIRALALRVAGLRSWFPSTMKAKPPSVVSREVEIVVSGSIGPKSSERIGSPTSQAMPSELGVFSLRLARCAMVIREMIAKTGEKPRSFVVVFFRSRSGELCCRVTEVSAQKTWVAQRAPALLRLLIVDKNK
ncbi:MAG TPA: hypothetical protein VID24_04405 [Candidatus Eremiobacteraceae bacterium]|jgi:hypothetical protein